MLPAPRQPLSRERVVAAALDAARRGEFETVTIRSLAAQLGAAPMSLYRHVRDKDDLLDEVVDALLTETGLPDTDPADWAAWMAEAARRLRRLIISQPAAAQAYTRRAVATPAALRRMEAALAVLRGAGFGPRQAAEGYATLHTYTLGFAVLEGARARGAEGEPGRETDDYWRALFAELPADEFPVTVALAPNLAGFTSDHQFTIGLERLLEGMRAQLRR